MNAILPRRDWGDLVVMLSSAVATDGQTLFSAAQPHAGRVTLVFLNGAKLEADDYALSGSTDVTLSLPAELDDTVEIYTISLVSGQTYGLSASYTATQGQTAFTAPGIGHVVMVFVNGAELIPGDYTISGTTVTLAEGATSWDAVSIHVLGTVGGFTFARSGYDETQTDAEIVFSAAAHSAGRENVPFLNGVKLGEVDYDLTGTHQVTLAYATTIGDAVSVATLG